MRIRIAVPESLSDPEKKEVLDAALEAVTRADEALVRSGKSPTAKDAIERLGVRWKPEPPGDEHFDLGTTVAARKWGDCDDLAPLHAASLRASGTDPGARAVVKKSGPTRWHAIVRRSDGSIEDPSLAAGMGRGVSGVSGGPVIYTPPIVSPMFVEAPEGVSGDDDEPYVRLGMAVHPLVGGAWAGRVDAPDDELGHTWVALNGARTPGEALCGAIAGVRLVGAETLDDLDDATLGATYDLLRGEDPELVREALEAVSGGDVGFFRRIARSVSRVTRPIAKVARPLARVALPIASSVIPGGAMIQRMAPKGWGGGGGLHQLRQFAAPVARGRAPNLRQLAPMAAQWAPMSLPPQWHMPGAMMRQGMPQARFLLPPQYGGFQFGARGARPVR